MRAGRRVWKSPDILSLDAWLTREIERLSTVTPLPRLLTPAEDWLLWRQCTAEATTGLDLVNRGALSEGLRRSAALAADFDIEARNIAGARGTEPTLLRDVLNTFDQRCRALGAASLSSLAGELAGEGTPAAGSARASRGVSPSGTAGPLCFEGFLKLTPRTAAIAAARGASHGMAAARATPQALLASDEWEELEAIAHWCAGHIARQPDARVLVVLPGAAGTRERLATLIRQAVDPRGWLEPRESKDSRGPNDSLVAVEGGRPLTTVPAIEHALSTLLWLSGAGGEFQEVSEWLRAPYWSLANTGSRSRLDLWLRELGRMRLSLHELASALRDAPSDCLDSARELQAQVARGAQILAAGNVSPRDWSHRFREALSAFGWPGDRPRNSADQQNVVRFHELLDEFGQLASASRSMSRDQAVQCLADLAARTAFQPADEDPTVTISSVLAAPVVHYDALWVAGLHSEGFPQPVQPDPFLSLAAQVAKGVPAASAAGRLVEAQGLLQAWRASTDDLVLSTAVRSEDLELLPSPLLRPWLADGVTVDVESRASADPARPHASAWLPTRLRREGWLETLDDSRGTEWPATRALPSGTKSLELQNLCPFKAYAELRLGSKSLDEPELGVKNTVRGNLLHAALSLLWSHFRDSRSLFGTFEPILDATIADCVEEAAKGIFEPGTLRSLSVTRECRRATRLIRELCALERERAPFQVQSTEQDTKLHIAGAVARMRVDRIDVLESGGRAILDYKSGRRASADWYGDRPSHPQLLAYLAALGDDIVAMSTVHVNAREVRFEGIAESRDLLPNVKGVDPPGSWKVRRAEWIHRLEELAKAFLAGNAVIDPKPGACEYCHVSSVCRISDRGSNDG
jgi:ATP-dependent helicase/nuclease subunit B